MLKVVDVVAGETYVVLGVAENSDRAVSLKPAILEYSYEKEYNDWTDWIKVEVVT